MKSYDSYFAKPISFGNEYFIANSRLSRPSSSSRDSCCSSPSSSSSSIIVIDFPASDILFFSEFRSALYGTYSSSKSESSWRLSSSSSSKKEFNDVRDLVCDCCAYYCFLRSLPEISFYSVERIDDGCNGGVAAAVTTFDSNSVLSFLDS